MKIVAAQIACTLGDSSANLAKIQEFATRAHEAGAELIVFPEMADTGYAMRVIRETAEPWNKGAVPELQKIARKLSLTVISGVSERTADSIHNSQVVIDPDGAIVAKYRKAHLFAPAPIEEDKCCTAGNELVTHAIGPLRFGLGICYDLRFPEFHRALAVEGKANVLVISSAWPFPRVEHLRILATARAIENQSYVIVANRVGTDDGVQFCGSSVVIDPSGIVVAAASSEKEDLLLAEVSPGAIEKVRSGMTVFAHRREDLYHPR